MKRSYSLINILLITGLCSLSSSGFAQQVEDVPRAFKSLSPNPEIIHLKTKLHTPTEGGHLQGIQLIEKNETVKLLISGSSSNYSYILEANLEQRNTTRLIPLMQKPYKHAGGIQVSENYLIVGIEDNEAKTSSKVCLYNIQNKDLDMAVPKLKILREGQAKRKTAGATGLLKFKQGYLGVVSNWDSRNWDFYSIEPNKEEQELIYSFKAPADWGSYQSINLIKDPRSIYAIGFYSNEKTGTADLILISHLTPFEPRMEKIASKSFLCKKKVDFNTAAGLQVDSEGKLTIWATQRNASKRIFINRFSEE